MGKIIRDKSIGKKSLRTKEWRQGLAMFCIMTYWSVTIQDIASLYRHSLFPTDFSLLFLGKKHQSATKSITCFFAKPKEKVVSPEGEDVSKESYATSSSKVQSTLDILVKSSIATKAEIMWVLKYLSCGFCNNLCKYKLYVQSDFPW